MLIVLIGIAVGVWWLLFNYAWNEHINPTIQGWLNDSNQAKGQTFKQELDKYAEKYDFSYTSAISLYSLFFLRRDDTRAVVAGIKADVEKYNQTISQADKAQAAQAAGAQQVQLPAWFSVETLNKGYSYIDIAMWVYIALVAIFILCYLISGLRVAFYKWPQIRSARGLWAICSFVLIPIYWLVCLIFASRMRDKIKKAEANINLFGNARGFVPEEQKSLAPVTQVTSASAPEAK